MINLPKGTKLYFCEKLVEVVNADVECSECYFYKKLFEDNDYLDYCYATKLFS